MTNKETNSDDILLFAVFFCGLPWVVTGGLLLIVYGFALFAFLYIFGMILERKRNQINNYKLALWLKIALISLCIAYVATAGYYLLPDAGIVGALKILMIAPAILVFPLMVSLPIFVYFSKR